MGVGWGALCHCRGSLCNQKWGLAAGCSTVHKEVWLEERKACCVSDAGLAALGEVASPHPSPLLPNPAQQSGGRSFCRQREGASGRNSTVSSDRHPQSGHRWSDECRLDRFRYSWSSVPGLVCSHFLRPVLRMVAVYVLAVVWSLWS